MPAFVVRPIGREITAAVRATMLAPQYGHPVHRELAKGTGPCRECLSTFAVGAEDRLLFTYNAHHAEPRTPRPGPVFIHADACESYAGDGFPPGLRDIPVMAEAHRDDGAVDAFRRIEPQRADAALDEILRDEGVAFVFLRHAEAGCFIARVDRVTAPRDTSGL